MLTWLAQELQDPQATKSSSVAASCEVSGDSCKQKSVCGSTAGSGGPDQDQGRGSCLTREKDASRVKAAKAENCAVQAGISGLQFANAATCLPAGVDIRSASHCPCH